MSCILPKDETSALGFLSSLEPNIRFGVFELFVRAPVASNCFANVLSVTDVPLPKPVSSNRILLSCFSSCHPALSTCEDAPSRVVAKAEEVPFRRRDRHRV